MAVSNRESPCAAEGCHDQHALRVRRSQISQPARTGGTTGLQDCATAARNNAADTIPGGVWATVCPRSPSSPSRARGQQTRAAGRRPRWHLTMGHERGAPERTEFTGRVGGGSRRNGLLHNLEVLQHCGNRCEPVASLSHMSVAKVDAFMKLNGDHRSPPSTRSAMTMAPINVRHVSPMIRTPSALEMASSHEQAHAAVMAPSARLPQPRRAPASPLSRRMIANAGYRERICIAGYARRCTGRPCRWR
jgi:hypothetical protein